MLVFNKINQKYFEKFRKTNKCGLKKTDQNEK